MGKGEDRAISIALRAVKVGGVLTFLGLNAYLFYRFSTAYGDGQQRAELLQKERDQRKKDGKDKPRAPVVPEEVQPEYVERQVRKYRQVVANEKKIAQPPQGQTEKL